MNNIINIKIIYNNLFTIILANYIVGNIKKYQINLIFYNIFFFLL